MVVYERERERDCVVNERACVFAVYRYLLVEYRYHGILLRYSYDFLLITHP